MGFKNMKTNFTFADISLTLLFALLAVVIRKNLLKRFSRIKDILENRIASFLP